MFLNVQIGFTIAKMLLNQSVVCARYSRLCSMYAHSEENYAKMLLNQTVVCARYSRLCSMYAHSEENYGLAYCLLSE